MHIFINGRFLAQRLTGVQRVAAELVRALDRRLATAPDRPHVTLLCPPDADPVRLPLAAIEPGRAGRMTGYLWEQVELPRHAAGGCLLNLGNVAPVTHPCQAVMIHDASVFDRPAGYSWRFRTIQRLLLPRIARRARWLLAPSAFSAGRLVANGVGSAERFTVIPNGADHLDRTTPDPSIREAAGLAPGRYVLFVGSPHPNKNLDGAIAAMARLGRPELPLAVVGVRDAAVFAGAGTVAGPSAVLLGAVDDAGLAGLYRDALCLLFPSWYEGFGLPPLEAMRLGCPVVASDRAAVPETCGDAAVLVDPDDPAAMAAAIRRIADDGAHRADLAARGRAHAADYTWDCAAARLWAAIGAGSSATPGGRPVSRASG